MPWHERSSSEKRRGPSERAWTSRAVHFAPMISAVAATAQVPARWTGFIVRTAIAWIVRRVGSDAERRGARVDLRNGEARDRAEALAGLARLRDPGVAGDREEDERVLHREAVLLHEQACCSPRHEGERLVVLGRCRVGQPAVCELSHRPRRLFPLEDVEAEVYLSGDLDAR